MDYTPKHAQPFTLNEVRELDIPEITKEISRLENSLFHLNRTQVELNAHLTGSKEEDRELLDIIRENGGVVASQTERISMLKLVLEDHGINTRSVHYDSANIGNSSVSEPAQPTGDPPADTDGNNSRSTEQGEPEHEDSDGGVYL